MRRRPSSPAPPPPMPDNDDMLGEILLRLPPLPSSLPRASLVCKRWLRLLSDPAFLRRFRAFHRRRRPPPLLGFFFDDIDGPCFTPSLDPPDRVPSARFSLPLPRGQSWSLLSCRHGLALLASQKRREVAVWDPVAGDQRRVALPPELPSYDADDCTALNGALLCGGGHSAGRVPLESFKVVLLWSENVEEENKVFVSVYESESDVWGEITSAFVRVPVHLMVPSVLLENSLCWLLLGYENGYRGGILEFDLVRQSLTLMDYPVEAHENRRACLQILRMEDAGLGFSITSDFSIQLWERVTSNDGAIWMLQKTIDLDKLLPPRPPVHRSATFVHGYDEDGNVVFVSTDLQLYTIELKSLKIRNISTTNFISIFYPYRSFYASGSCIGSGDVGVETLNNA
ncbi:hypothetical protein ACP4OV_010225 [Aristida adscensionis]